MYKDTDRLTFEVSRVARKLTRTDRRWVIRIRYCCPGYYTKRVAAFRKIRRTSCSFGRCSGEAQPVSKEGLRKLFLRKISAGNPFQIAVRVGGNLKLLRDCVHIIQPAFFEQSALAVVTVHIRQIEVVCNRSERLHTKSIEVPNKFQRRGVLGNVANEWTVSIHFVRAKVGAGAQRTTARIDRIVYTSRVSHSVLERHR